MAGFEAAKALRISFVDRGNRLEQSRVAVGCDIDRKRPRRCQSSIGSDGIASNEACCPGTEEHLPLRTF